MMASLTYRNTLLWLKQGNTPLARGLCVALKRLRQFQLPRVPLLFSFLFRLYALLTTVFNNLLRLFWWTPLFRSQVGGSCEQLYLYGGLPFMTGGLRVSVKDRCRISGQTTFSARTCSAETPELQVGHNVDIGWQTTIAVGKRVIIGDNVRIAGQCLLAGYPGHPLNAQRRAAGEPDDEFQAGDIVLEPDVWLATGVKVMAGVRIKQGTIVAAGSVVTQDLPAGVLAGGVPARVIKTLEDA